MNQLKTIHKPVLLQEVIESLMLENGQVVFDGTLGGGGYSEKICQKIGKKGILIGTDLDRNALKRSKDNLKNCPSQKYFFQKNYSQIKEILKELEIDLIDRMVLDLGISSDQLEKEKRGISFLNLDDPLDMNLSLDNKNKLTAKEILNTWSEESLADIFFYYGGEKASRKMAGAIIERRKKKEFEKVSDLVSLIEMEIGKFYRKRKIHPATKIFQALRIAVNDEIRNLKKALGCGINSLKNGGIIVVVSFHSLEDRNVKKIFREMEKEGVGKRINKKVIIPSKEELKENKRARSAKLRAFQKVV